MAQNKLSTRMAQKIDTLDAWASSTIVPLKGEICVATDSDGKVVETKIGDGVNTYSNLFCIGKTIFVGTMQEYEDVADDYPLGSLIVITNDEGGEQIDTTSLLDLFTDEDSLVPPEEISTEVQDLFDNDEESEPNEDVEDLFK